MNICWKTYKISITFLQFRIFLSFCAFGLCVSWRNVKPFVFDFREEKQTSRNDGMINSYERCLWIESLSPLSATLSLSPLAPLKHFISLFSTIFKVFMCLFYDYAIKIKSMAEKLFSFFRELPSWKFWRRNNFNVLIKITLTLSFIPHRGVESSEAECFTLRKKFK